jgi:hypothetical protein
VNLKTGKVTGLKSHDFHILMEGIIPIMFLGYMPNAMWQAIAELSYFYRQICAKDISKNMMEKLQKEIPVLLCRPEKIFPPGFFNPMEHLLILRWRSFRLCRRPRLGQIPSWVETTPSVLLLPLPTPEPVGNGLF